MKAFLSSGVVAVLVPGALLVWFFSGCVFDDREAYRITPPIFGKAVVVCANLGGLKSFSAVKWDTERAMVRATCNTGVEARFQIRYDGKPEGESK
jgi:hypothetical protein